MPTGNQPQRVSRTTLASLTSRLRARIETTVNASDDEHPPGLSVYSASFFLLLDHEDIAELPEADGAALLAAADDDDEEELVVGIGSWNFGIADAFEPQVFDALDSRDGDWGLLAEVLFTGTQCFSNAFSEKFPNVIQTDIIVGHDLQVHEMFRGADLGLIGLATVIHEMSRGVDAVAIQPMHVSEDVDDRDEAALRAAQDASYKGLSTYYAKLGFVPFGYGTMVLDLTTTEFEKTRRELLGQ